MRLLTRMVVGLLSLCSTGAALAQNTILLGTIDKVEFFREGTASCPVTCPDVDSTENGVQKICLSRHGDCEFVRLQVIELLAGPDLGLAVTGRSKLGEFDRPTIPMETRQVIAEIDERGYATYIGATYSNDGIVLLPKSWAKISGIDLLPMKNDHGVVPLTLLRQRLGDRERE